MNLSLAIVAVSFLPFFEARNQVANFVFDPPPEGKTVKPVLPNLTVTETCPGCDGKGELVLEEPDYGQAKGRIGPAKKTRKQCPLCKGKTKIQDNKLHFLQCACKFTEQISQEMLAGDDLTSKRKKVKNLIAKLAKEDPQIEANIFRSTQNVNLAKIVEYKDKDGNRHNFLDDYDKKKK